MKRQSLAIAITFSLASPVLLAQPPEIEEISVIGQFVPDEKRGTDQVANVVDSEEFQRTGDSNIAESLKRVAGLSTIDGKFVYVRGLGERYSTTLLNGALLPSPEPINRVVPMDLFPTAVLESVLVQKTYSAAYPSEFGGGVLQMRTKKSTDEFFWNVSSSVGLVQDVNFNNGFTVSGGDTDWLGMDDGWRAQPLALMQATENNQKLQPYSRFSGTGIPIEQLQEVGRSLNNQYSLENESLPPNLNVSSSLGNFHEIGDSGMQINYLAAVDYSNSWDTNEIERNNFVPGTSGLNQNQAMIYVGTENSIDMSGIFSSGLDINPNHNVRLTSVVLRKTDNIASQSNGYNNEANNLSLTEIEWIERELFSNQLQGDHYFPEFNNMTVNWRASRIKAERDSPDHRVYRRDGGELSSRVDGNLRTFSVLDDTAEEFGVDLAMEFYGPGGLVITPQVGYVNSDKQRQSEIRRFGFAFVGSDANDTELLMRPLEDIFAPENIRPSAFQIRELTRPTDNYEAKNELEAYYGQVEFNFDDRLRFTFGARQEDFRQQVNTFDLFNPNVASAARQNSSELLPAFNATYIHNDHQFRLGYSETVSRPDFRELSPAAFTNPVSGKEVVGNPDLEITEITNYDARWEWYFGFSDYMSLGVFYKEFLNPIEAAIIDPISFKTTYINAASADNQGVEWEIYKRLDFLPDSFFNGIGEDFYVQTNVAFIDSEVTIRDEDQGVLTSTTRALQGQSDWLFNAQIGYEPFSGTTATLLYHYFGERIVEVGIEGAPDLVEQAFGELNFVFIKSLNDHWSATLKAKNILDERSQIMQDDKVVTAYNRGREISFKLDYAF